MKNNYQVIHFLRNKSSFYFIYTCLVFLLKILIKSYQRVDTKYILCTHKQVNDT